MKAPPAGMRRLYTPPEVSAKLRVKPRTVTKWAKAGKFPAATMIRTPGGELRCDADYIDQLVSGEILPGPCVLCGSTEGPFRNHNGTGGAVCTDDYVCQARGWKGGQR